MIIARVTGGLGNQLFQYAMARRLALKHGAEILLDTRGYGPNGEERARGLEFFSRPLLIERFQINVRRAADAEIGALADRFSTRRPRDRAMRLARRVVPNLAWKRSHRVEPDYRFHPEALSWPNNVYVQGFWQSERYFADIAALVRNEIHLKDGTEWLAAKNTVADLRAQYGVVVSLHVRRGDLAHAHEVLGKPDLTHGAPISRAYINDAMRRFDENVCYFVFSDSPSDIQWCRENITAKNIRFSTGESAIYDFGAMMYCDHHIIANSTFSWWAAWLDEKADKRVIAPRVWTAPGSGVVMPTDDLIPAEWDVL